METESTGANVVMDSIIGALISNVPTEATKHIINGSSAQYSNSLYGTGINNPNDTGKDAQYCQPVSSSAGSGGSSSRSSSSSSSSSRRKDTLEQKKCSTCNKDCQTPNNLMKIKLKDCIEKMGKADFQNSPHHFTRNSFLNSSNVDEHLVNIDILTWVPDLIYKSSLVRCWQKDCGGGLKRTRILTRSVESLDGVKFVLYAQYECEKCHVLKTSLDLEAMAQSGYPLPILDLCPVVPFKKSSVEKETYEMLITLCTAGMSFEAFQNLVQQKRFRAYTKAASFFLQMQSIMHVAVQPLKASTGLGFSGVAILGLSQTHFSPFPEFESHCNGWGGGRGFTADQWANVFMDGTKTLQHLAEAVETSIGGVSLSHDVTYAVAQHIHVQIPQDQGGPMTAPVQGLSIGKLVHIPPRQPPMVYF
jgi:hypothetical protein